MCRFTRVELPPATDAARRARTFVRETLSRWELADLADDLALLASELVTNAVLHARTACTLTVSVAEGTVEVSVADQAETRPQLRATARDLLAALDAAEREAGDWDDPASQAGRGSVFSGRGLLLVDAVAQRWGTAPATTGKSVWLTVPAPRSWPYQSGCRCRAAPTHRTGSGQSVADMTAPP